MRNELLGNPCQPHGAALKGLPSWLCLKLVLTLPRFLRSSQGSFVVGGELFKNRRPRSLSNYAEGGPCSSRCLLLRYGCRARRLCPPRQLSHSSRADGAYDGEMPCMVQYVLLYHATTPFRQLERNTLLFTVPYRGAFCQEPLLWSKSVLFLKTRGSGSECLRFSSRSQGDGVVWDQVEEGHLDTTAALESQLLSSGSGPCDDCGPFRGPSFGVMGCSLGRHRRSSPLASGWAPPLSHRPEHSRHFGGCRRGPQVWQALSG